MKKSHIDVGTIGSRPCEKALNSILMNLPEDLKVKTVRKVMKRLMDLKEGLVQIRHIPDKSFRISLLRMFYEQHRGKLIDANLPELVHTHTLCCMAAHFKNEMKVLQPPGKRRLRRIAREQSGQQP